jgi:hypothetical protein
MVPISPDFGLRQNEVDAESQRHVDGKPNEQIRGGDKIVNPQDHREV